MSSEAFDTALKPGPETGPGRWENFNRQGAALFTMYRCLVASVLVLVSAALAGCDQEDEKSIVVYTSVDQHFSEPVLRAFEKETGIHVKALYDVEAAKTTGIVNRLVAESDRPRADVFWNGESLQMVLLERRGVLAPYEPQSLGEGQSQDEHHSWTAFGGRARVFIVNTSRLKETEWPTSISDFLSDRWTGNSLAMANPLFGTTATQAAALYAAWGDKAASEFFRSLRDRGVRIVDGNSVVRDLAVNGDIAFGLTDTDDACNAVAKGAQVAVVLPDQAQDGLGTLVIPNTVALIAGAPHPDAGKKFIDYLLGMPVARDLGKAGWFHVDGRNVLAAAPCGLPDTFEPMTVDPAALYDALDRARRNLRELLID